MAHTASIPAEALTLVHEIEGWLSDREAGLLYGLAREASGPIVEIGSHAGRSTAALALGSMNGGGQPIYAIDSFVGVPSRHGRQAAASSADRLRANLDRAGVNGVVTVIPETSLAALTSGTLPKQCGLLFVDGDHDRAARDLDMYLPRVAAGGVVVLHDFGGQEPGVIEAAEAHLFSRPQAWRVLRRCDSCLVARKQQTCRKTVMLGIPASQLHYAAHRAILQASFGAHAVVVEQSGHGWDDMNELWVRGLNAARQGEVTHFAMLHADVAPHAGWLDCLLAELEDNAADLISTVVPIKDARGLTTCGLGDRRDPWSAHRRLTMREIMRIPETFDVGDACLNFSVQDHWRLPGTDNVYLLHNTGCWAANLTNQQWYETEGPLGQLVASFQFPIRARKLIDGTIRHERESEDWYFSRRIAELPLQTAVTRKVELSHIGEAYHPNFIPWGEWDCDLGTAARWQRTECGVRSSECGVSEAA